MNEDKVVEKFAKGVSQIAGALMVFLLASAATATDPFFRKNMGERYLSWMRIVISTIGWGAVVFAACIPGKAINGTLPLRPLISGIIIILAYLGLSIVHYNVMLRNRRAGAYWHSKSRGESLFGEESVKRDLVIEFLVIVVLCLFSWMYAAFFFLSRALGYMADAIARAAFYNKYLDIEDAKIEAKFMEVALRDGLAPGLTAGYFMPLNKDLKGNFRANVARVASDGMGEVTGFRPITNEPQLPESAPEISEADPYDEIKANALSAIKKLFEKSGSILTAFRLNAVRYRRSAVMLLIVAATTWGGVYVVRSIQRQSAEPDAAFSMQKLIQKIKAGNDKTGEEFLGMLDSQKSMLMKFAQDCVQRLNANSNNIAEVRMTRRKELHAQNNQARIDAFDFLQRQESFLDETRKSLNKGTNPGFDPQTLREKLNASFSKMETERSTISNQLNRVEIAISNAPPKFKLKLPWF